MECREHKVCFQNHNTTDITTHYIICNFYSDFLFIHHGIGNHNAKGEWLHNGNDRSTWAEVFCVLKNSYFVKLWRTMKNKVIYHPKPSWTYSEHSQTSKMEPFGKIVNYFCQKCYLWCLTRFWTGLCEWFDFIDFSLLVYTDVSILQ